MPKFLPSPEQQRAIAHVRGPMLVVAGAGTGKTTVLVRRVAALIDGGHARPDEIQLVTYTENAAARMRTQLSELVGPLWAGQVRAGTFHAWCYQLIKDHGRGFDVVDEVDLWIYLRRRLAQRELPLERFVRAASPAQFLHDLLRFFARCHDELVDAAAYEQYVAELAAGRRSLPRVGKADEELPREEVIARCREIAAVFRTVERMLAQDGLGTFGHMILGAVELLRREPAVLAAERQRARFLLIDEFQDANVAQIELAALLAGEAQNIFAVGDPDQAIYRFRGACSAAFDEFVRRFPQAATAHLFENRRSRQAILDCAWEVISHNPSPVSEQASPALKLKRHQLRSAREDEAAKQGRRLLPVQVDAVITIGAETEAVHVAEAMVQRQASLACRCPGRPHEFGWCNFAVLYRQHAHRTQVARELAARHVPFVVKGMGVRDTREGRDALAALRAVAAPGDAVSVLRVAALPQFGLAPAALRDELGLRRSDPSLTAALEKVPGGAAVLAALATARRRIQPETTPAPAALQTVQEVFALPESTPLAVLREYVRRWQEKAITRTGSLAEFLDYLRWLEEQDKEIQLPEARDADAAAPDAVRLLTAHTAKGLEFTAVFVLRANRQSFPTQYHQPLFDLPAELRSRMAAADDGRELHGQEERRLFYVAMTRARDALTICARAGRGKRDPRPDGYLRDLIGKPGLEPVLRVQHAQTLGTIAAAAALAPIGEWVSLAPAASLVRAPLSATAIDRYQRCPLQFKLERDWQLPTDTPAALRYGKAVHDALKAYFDGIRQGRPLAVERLLGVFRDALAALPIEDPHQASLYLKQGEAELRAFAAATRAAPLPAVIATEQTFELKLGGVTLRGRIDRLDRLHDKAVAVVDYKTGSPRDQKEADASTQLGLYALAARHLGFVPERLVLHNLENNEAVVTVRDPSDLAALEAKVAEVAAQIAAGEFDPKPGFHCRFCGYRPLCPATEEQNYAAN